MFFDDPEQKQKKEVHLVLRAFFEVLSDSVLRDNELINFCLSYLDGILEDSRTRVKFFLEIMNAFKDKMDLIAILFNFIKKSGE